MELRHLRYFVAVAEAENVSRAALKLHVSQPALSRQIRDLEDDLGFLLLERTAKSVTLTEAGRVFLTESQAVLQRTEEAVLKARAVAAGCGGELHVGYSPTPTARILSPTLRAFQAKMPKVRVKLHDLTGDEMIEEIRDGKLQLGFIVKPGKAAALRGMRFEELLRDPVRLAVAPHNPLARLRVVPLEDAARESFIAYSRKDYPGYHDLLEEAFAAIKVKPRIAEEHEGVSSLIPAIEAGQGVALVAESMACVAGNRLKLLRLSPSPAPLVIGIIAPNTGLTAAGELFWECAREAMQKV